MRTKARIAGVFYLITFVMGTVALMWVPGRFAANLIAGAAYVAVTLLFYEIFKPVNKTISLIAAIVGMAGCVIGALANSRPAAVPVNSLVFFGVYCLLIGYLIMKSTFLPRILGVLMAIGGLGWLTFLSPALAASLAPYNFAPGMLGEGLLTLWLLSAGLNAPRWNESATVTV